MKKSRIGMLTGGGDCAGLNPAIKWVVKTATDDRLQAERGVQYEVVGIRDGWKGLVEADPSRGDAQEWLMPLDQNTVRTWDRFGGTMLGTSRTNPYDPKNDQSKKVLENIEQAGAGRAGGHRRRRHPGRGLQAGPGRREVWSAFPRPSTRTSGAPTTRWASSRR